MNRDHLFEVGGDELVERGNDTDARVVDEDVKASPGIKRGLDNGTGALFLGDTVKIGDRFASCVHDLLRHHFGARWDDASPVRSDTQVVHDDLRAALSQEPGVRPAEARVAAGAGHDRDPSVEPH